MVLERYKDPTLLESIPIYKDGAVDQLSLEQIKSIYSVANIIKIRAQEFSDLDGLPHRFTHFNFEYTDHKRNEIYLVVKIRRGGYFDGEREQMPLIELDGAYRMRCINVINGLRYSEIPDDLFKFSLPHVQSVTELRETILSRYKVSLSHLTDKEKIRRGVGVTELCMIGKASQPRLVE